MYRMEELQEVIKQEKELRLKSCTYQDGIRIGQTVFDMAVSRNLNVCCQVVIGEFPVTRWFLDGTGSDNVIWLERKKNTVLKKQMSSLRCGMEAELLENREEWYADEEHYVIRGGGFPLYLQDGTFAGALCVSGLQHQEDHKLAAEALQIYLKQMEEINEN